MNVTTQSAGAMRQHPPAWSNDVRRSHDVSSIRIPLNSRNHPDLFATIDAADYPLVSGYRWRALGRQGQSFYAYHSGRRHVVMHRLILGLGHGDPDVDHIDGDGLNNTRSNLRLCSDSLNQANRHRLLEGKSSRFRGVTWHKQLGKWQAAIKVKSKNHYLGVFNSEIDAARAYNAAALLHFGEFASLNELGAA